jgi:hypothetical protein
MEDSQILFGHPSSRLAVLIHSCSILQMASLRLREHSPPGDKAGPLSPDYRLSHATHPPSLTGAHNISHCVRSTCYPNCTRLALWSSVYGRVCIRGLWLPAVMPPPPAPGCDHQNCFQDLPNVPWEAEWSWLAQFTFIVSTHSLRDPFPVV